MTLRLQSFILLMLIVCSARCESENESNDVCMTQTCQMEAENILAKLDATVDPCEDFYLFACGNFVNETVIPDDKTAYDVSTGLDEQMREQLNEVLNTSVTAKDIYPFVLSKKLYKACLAQDLIEMRGLKPMKAIIESLGGWPILEGKNWDDHFWYWQRIILQLELLGFEANEMFSLTIDTDMKNSSKRIIYIDQPNLGIEREYLVKGLEDEVVKAYFKYQVDTAVLYGADRAFAESEAKDVLNYEMKLAKILIAKEERRNMTHLYNPMTVKEFQHLFPVHDWYKYLNLLIKGQKISEAEEIIVTDFKYIIDEVHELLKKTPNRVLINYLMWRTVSSVSTYLNQDIRNRSLEFSKVLSGKQSYEKRWKECIDEVLENLPIATSALYVTNFFNKQSREIASELVDSLKGEVQSILKSLPWMDEETKTEALVKAKKMVAHIGYPDELTDDSKLIDYHEDLQIDENEYLESVLNISRFNMNKIIGNLRKPLNKTFWENHAQVAMVNAFYSPMENSIQFPAGILQGIFFNADRPRYMNYGAIGSVIGHEITHGFDDEGSQFDYDGNLVNWWQDDTKKAYLEKAQCIIDQYGNFTEANVNLQLNGINTQGENIADNGGIKIAYFAYQDFVKQNGVEAKLPELNFTSNQLFWISAAQSWCSVSRPERMKLLITLNPHSPEMFRVNGPFSNMKEFASEFQCSEGSKMNPIQKCEVW